MSAKKSNKIARMHLARTLRLVLRAKFFLRIISGRICVRASATSRTVSYASHQASQAKSNVNQADTASPFGQLLAATAPKQATSQKDQKDTSDSGDADNTSAAKQDAKQDNSSGATQTAAQNVPSPRPATKTGKADKSDDKPATKARSNTADDSQNTTIDQQLAELQAVSPAPAAPAPAAATVKGSDDLAIDTLAAAAQAGTPSSGLPTDAAIPEPAAPKPSDAAAAQAASAQQADDSQIDDLQLQMSVAARALAAQSGSTPSTSGDDTAETGATVVAANDGQKDVISAGATQAGGTTKNTARNGKSTGDSGQAGAGRATVIAAAQSGVAKSDAAQGDINKGDINKGDVNKNGIARIRSAQNGAANDVARDKTDTGNTDGVAEPKITSAQVTLDSLQSPAPKAAPPPMQAANGNFDMSAMPLQPGLVSASTQQDIQVSAKPAPNLPALAVEIAARSQSGAKQFDIRLDPPELGRVDVRLSIDATGKASAHLSADQPHTLTLLQNDAPALTRALREAGLDVSQNGLNFSLRQGSENYSGNTDDNGRRGTSRAFSLTATADIDASAVTTAYRGIANGRLDIRV